MERRTLREAVASNVAEAMTREGASAETVSNAADIPTSTFSDRLASESPFTLAELAEVGGVLHVRPSSFFEEVNA